MTQKLKFLVSAIQDTRDIEIQSRVSAIQDTRDLRGIHFPVDWGVLNLQGISCGTSLGTAAYWLGLEILNIRTEIEELILKIEVEEILRPGLEPLKRRLHALEEAWDIAWPLCQPFISSDTLERCRKKSAAANASLAAADAARLATKEGSPEAPTLRQRAEELAAEYRKFH